VQPKQTCHGTDEFAPPAGAIVVSGAPPHPGAITELARGLSTSSESKSAVPILSRQLMYYLQAEASGAVISVIRAVSGPIIAGQVAEPISLSGSSMQEILAKLESVLDQNDLYRVRHGVDELLTVFVPRNASPEVREQICTLLERKAAGSTNPVLTSYLRTVSQCVRDFKFNIGTCIKEPPVAVPVVPNRLGQYLNERRKQSGS
jgi:hypothetical protein